jgi:hypothetical protein
MFKIFVSLISGHASYIASCLEGKSSCHITMQFTTNQIWDFQHTEHFVATSWVTTARSLVPPLQTVTLTPFSQPCTVSHPHVNGYAQGFQKLTTRNTFKCLAREEWQETSSIVRTHQYYAPSHKIQSPGRPGARKICTRCQAYSPWFISTPQPSLYKQTFCNYDSLLHWTRTYYVPWYRTSRCV